MSTYETFPGTSVVGMPNRISLADNIHTYKTKFQAGYTQTIARDQNAPKSFDVEWLALDYEEWLSMAMFLRANAGYPFYWQYPTGVYGESPFGGSSSTRGHISPVGFGSKLPYGYGDGPYFLVALLEDTFSQEYDLDTDSFNVSFRLSEVSTNQ